MQQQHHLSKEKMQFAKLFKVKFTVVLVKGIRLAPVKLNHLFTIVKYMYVTHAARATTIIITITIKAARRDVLRPKRSY